MKTETFDPVTLGSAEPDVADCVELMRSLQQLNRARRRSDNHRQDAGTLMMLSNLEGTPGARISAIADLLLIDISAASRQISALEAAGLVVRVKDECDHRAQLVRLTGSGESTLASARQTYGSDIARRISSWSGDDLRTLNGLLRRLADDLVAGEPGCSKTPLAHSTQYNRTESVSHS
ncbi:DNA-binding MarR family transcriptional regulator [Nakamurella sp. UYEF19]|uniref:MarR family winged helix-turn-helix transcriptional regulator n=1 Tax=Nakamurella sp. UYEF19 TaxID=1756392 RepID=UPI003399023B